MTAADGSRNATNISDIDMKAEVIVIPVAEWSDWYSRYMVAESAGTELPT